MHRPKKHSDLNNGYLITLVHTPVHLGHEVVMLVYCNVYRTWAFFKQGYIAQQA